jgi:hypothetical protein
MRRALAIAALGLALAGCKTLSMGAGEPETVAAMPGQVEPLHAAAFTNDLAVFWVSSNGCTTKEDLRPIVQMRGGDAVITLRRIEEDPCDQPVTDGVELQWSFEELGLPEGSAVSVNNPYQLPSNLVPTS